ncbi:hypothetical protein V8C86DRAFT_2790319 [Haematococcus lacustris]
MTLTLACLAELMSQQQVDGALQTCCLLTMRSHLGTRPGKPAWLPLQEGRLAAGRRLPAHPQPLACPAPAAEGGWGAQAAQGHGGWDPLAPAAATRESSPASPRVPYLPPPAPDCSTAAVLGADPAIPQQSLMLLQTQTLHAMPASQTAALPASPPHLLASAPPKLARQQQEGCGVLTCSLLPLSPSSPLRYSGATAAPQTPVRAPPCCSPRAAPPQLLLTALQLWKKQLLAQGRGPGVAAAGSAKAAPAP